MKATINLAYRAIKEIEDHKVIKVRQYGKLPEFSDSNEYKEDNYIRADIVEKIIDAYADVRVDNTYDTGGHYGDLTHEEELQLEKNRIFGIYGLNK